MRFLYFREIATGKVRLRTGGGLDMSEKIIIYGKAG
jgi:hypothetical protein